MPTFRAGFPNFKKKWENWQLPLPVAGQVSPRLALTGGASVQTWFRLPSRSP